MKWFETLYLSDSVIGREQDILNKVNNGAVFNSAYFVCLSSNKKDLFDIISARELGQKNYPKTDVRVLGICGTKDEAMELVVGLVQNTIQKNGDLNFHYFLNGTWRDSFDFS